MQPADRQRTHQQRGKRQPEPAPGQGSGRGQARDQQRPAAACDRDQQQPQAAKPHALPGFGAALAPVASLSWYRVNVETMVFVVILAAGYGLEYLVAARTGRRALGQAGQHAQDR
jgi:hypothetical protein